MCWQVLAVLQGSPHNNIEACLDCNISGTPCQTASTLQDITVAFRISNLRLACGSSRLASYTHAVCQSRCEHKARMSSGRSMDRAAGFPPYYRVFY